MAEAIKPRGGFWGELTANERTALEAVGTIRTYQASATLFLQGDPAEHVFILWSGCAKIVSETHTGHCMVLAFRGPGDIVGELAGTDGGLRSASVEVIEPVKALLIDVKEFGAYLDRSPHASSVLRQVLVGRLREADRHRLAAATMAVGQRLALLLLDLAERYPAPAEGGGTRIGLALSQEDLAGCIGASRRAVAREIEGWRDRGIVATGRRTVIIRQPAVLQRIAGVRH
jgi:CRP-like cAMP-binding protein